MRTIPVAAEKTAFTPALIVVDFQEDFCPPAGSLAVPDGRSIASVVNLMLSLPFALKLATRDWHPPNHISFASNHASSPAPFVSRAVVHHPLDASRSYSTILWPAHCLQNSPGAQLVPELNDACLDAIVNKGTDPCFEMYSAFYDPFRLTDTGLSAMLSRHNVTHVYIVGLAADFCVARTAEHASDEGFTSYIIAEGTKPVYPEKWPDSGRQVFDKGVRLISVDGYEVSRQITVALPSSDLFRLRTLIGSTVILAIRPSASAAVCTTESCRTKNSHRRLDPWMSCTVHCAVPTCASIFYVLTSMLATCSGGTMYVRGEDAVRIL